MTFPAHPEIQSPGRLNGSLGVIDEFAARTAALRPEAVLTAFAGTPLDPRTLHVCGVHHVAVYVGDYQREEEVDEACEELRRAHSEGVRSGASYIAPRHHGTPGYWINCRRGGRELELFTCKHAGDWALRGPDEKALAMSHLALRVSGGDHVLPVLDYLAHHADVELLAFSQPDVLGHTYGHVRNRRSGRVLELVHDAHERAS